MKQELNPAVVVGVIVVILVVVVVFGWKAIGPNHDEAPKIDMGHMSSQMQAPPKK